MLPMADIIIAASSEDGRRGICRHKRRPRVTGDDAPIGFIVVELVDGRRTLSRSASTLSGIEALALGRRAVAALLFT
jgi:hypothetical protein